jgi:hypothetical protein
MIQVLVDKVNLSEWLKDCSDIILRQTVSHVDEEQPVVRDRRVGVLVRVESGRQAEAGREVRELNALVSSSFALVSRPSCFHFLAAMSAGYRRLGMGSSRSSSDELLDCLAFAITLCFGKLDDDRDAHHDSPGELRVS